MALPVGVDDLNVYGSTLSVDLADVARARGLPAKSLETTQFRRRSVTPPYEDPVTLAVNAARPLVAADADDVELLVVATESGLDYGKPLSSYVHRALGLPERCRNFEVKHACYGGTAALQMAASWVRAQTQPGKRALVVMTDLARRHVGDPAELTAGSGAVALTIAAEPRVLELGQRSGYASREVYDVARPTATGEWGDAVLSLYAYLDLLELAWEHYQGQDGGGLDAHFRYVLYHTPLVSLAERAHRTLIELDDPDAEAADAEASFDRMVRPALGYAAELANTYSGSVYTLLAGLIDAVPSIEPGTPIGLFSYGSGACAELYGGRLCAAASATVGAHRIGAHLADRRPIDVAAYEALVDETERCLTSPEYDPPRDAVPEHFASHYEGRGRLVLEAVRNHHRSYAWT